MAIKTYYAPAEKVDDQQLLKEIIMVNRSPVINGIMEIVGGLLAIMNEQRQILALNESFLEQMGIGNAKTILGLRLGESLKCIHADKAPGGCGTSQFCTSCGAAIAIVSSLGMNEAVEKTCAITIKRYKKLEDLYLRVRSYPIKHFRKRFLLLFFQDISRQQQWASLEHAFYHDINNMVLNLLMGTEMLLEEEDLDSLRQFSHDIHQSTRRLASEIEIQRILSTTEKPVYQVSSKEISLNQIFSEIQNMFSNHPASRNKTINITANYPDIIFKTDISLLLRILNNMVLNALEATPSGGEIKLWISQANGNCIFYVWNQKPIPREISRRIFQRNFSTKEEIGKGLGTYSMKLFGEQFLAGKVSFTSSKKEGTTFCFQLPV